MYECYWPPVYDNEYQYAYEYYTTFTNSNMYIEYDYEHVWLYYSFIDIVETIKC